MCVCFLSLEDACAALVCVMGMFVICFLLFAFCNLFHVVCLPLLPLAFVYAITSDDVLECLSMVLLGCLCVCCGRLEGLGVV